MEAANVSTPQGIDITQLPGPAQRMLGPQAPPPLKLMGARGIVPGLKPDAVVTLVSAFALGSDPELSREIYSCVESIVLGIGAERDDLVPFEKYAAAAEQLVRPSSVARALSEGATAVERVDRLIQAVGRQVGVTHPAIDRIVALVDAGMDANRARAA